MLRYCSNKFSFKLIRIICRGVSNLELRIRVSGLDLDPDFKCRLGRIRVFYLDPNPEFERGRIWILNIRKVGYRTSKIELRIRLFIKVGYGFRLFSMVWSAILLFMILFQMLSCFIQISIK